MGEMMRNSRMNGALGGGDSRMMSANCLSLQKKLQSVDFAIVDTVLYLNAYPENREALEFYHKLVKEREELAATINEKCGPIDAMSNKSRTEWNWVDGPWPWEPEAN